MIIDPLFYLAVVPALILVGLAKGGFCGPLSMLGVPIAALVISPVQAAAILLPILVCMDIVGLMAYRGKANWPMLREILPFAFLGVFLGWLLADQVSDDVIRLLVGLVALAFVADYSWRKFTNRQIRARGTVSAALCGTTSGFTSFIAHAGNPPYQIHALPLGMDPIRFAATSVHYFTIVNLVKLIPYFALGQFNSDNLSTTLVLLPIAPVSILIGVYLVKRVSQTTFYSLTYAAMLIIALKLCWDSLTSLL